LKKGTCSRTFFYILDREFGHPRDEEEKAIDPLAGGILQTFYEASDYEMQCDKICGQCFETLDEHTEFVKNGGCGKLIDVLAETN